MTRLSTIVAAVLLSLAAISASHAAIEERRFEDPVTQERYYNLIAELRCLVCQNQNLADSNADLARDLRDKTAEMLEQGKTDQEILDYMSDRYGDFVLYRPPFRSDTAVLWLGPLILLIVVLLGLVLFLRRRRLESQVDNPEARSGEPAHQRARDLLANSDSKNQ